MLSQVIEDGQIVDSYFTIDPLTLNTKNADALILGSSTTEGGDIKVYRDASGNLQMSLNADSAINQDALIIYGGINAAYVIGTNGVKTGVNGFYSYTNQAYLPFNIKVDSPDAIAHTIKFQIDSNDIICIRATGDGTGGITNKAIGLYGTTPSTQATAISDPTESIAANNAAIDSILVALREIGLIAT